MLEENETTLRKEVEKLLDNKIEVNSKELEATRKQDTMRMEKEKDQKIIEIENKMVNLVAKLNMGETGALIQEFNDKLEKMQISNLNVNEKV